MRTGLTWARVGLLVVVTAVLGAVLTAGLVVETFSRETAIDRAV